MDCNSCQNLILAYSGRGAGYQLTNFPLIKRLENDRFERSGNLTCLEIMMLYISHLVNHLPSLWSPGLARGGGWGAVHTKKSLMSLELQTRFLDQVHSEIINLTLLREKKVF